MYGPRNEIIVAVMGVKEEGKKCKTTLIPSLYYLEKLS